HFCRLRVVHGPVRESTSSSPWDYIDRKIGHFIASLKHLFPRGPLVPATVCSACLTTSVWYDTGLLTPAVFIKVGILLLFVAIVAITVIASLSFGFASTFGSSE